MCTSLFDQYDPDHQINRFIGKFIHARLAILDLDFVQASRYCGVVPECLRLFVEESDFDLGHLALVKILVGLQIDYLPLPSAIQFIEDDINKLDVIIRVRSGKAIGNDLMLYDKIGADFLSLYNNVDDFPRFSDPVIIE